MGRPLSLSLSLLVEGECAPRSGRNNTQNEQRGMPRAELLCSASPAMLVERHIFSEAKEPKCRPKTWRACAMAVWKRLRTEGEYAPRNGESCSQNNPGREWRLLLILQQHGTRHISCLQSPAEVTPQSKTATDLGLIHDPCRSEPRAIPTTHALSGCGWWGLVGWEQATTTTTTPPSRFYTEGLEGPGRPGPRERE